MSNGTPIERGSTDNLARDVGDAAAADLGDQMNKRGAGVPESERNAAHRAGEQEKNKAVNKGKGRAK